MSATTVMLAVALGLVAGVFAGLFGVGGGILFVPAALLTAPSGEASVKTAWRHFVLDPAERIFQRPLGDF